MEFKSTCSEITKTKQNSKKHKKSKSAKHCEKVRNSVKSVKLYGKCDPVQHTLLNRMKMKGCATG